jgi:heptosyltransferase-2
MSWLQTPPKNIIVRMPNWVGDLVMATPVLEDLRHQWPEAKITAMCKTGLASLLDHDPNVDEIFSFRRPSGWIHHIHSNDIIDPLRLGKFDLGVLLTNSFSSAWWFWRGHVRNRIGYKGNMRNWLLNKAVPFPPAKETQHLVITYKMLLEPLGIPVSSNPPRLYVAPEETAAARALLATYGVKPGNIVVGINPGAAYGSAKCWLPERYREVTLRLMENPNTYVVYFGDPVGAPLVQTICTDMPERVINLAGRTTLRELMALIKSCSIFLTNDSGPMHMASALNIPLLALFGSTSDVKTGPYNGGKIIHKHVECSPCYLKVCPIDFRCMTRIEVNEVYNDLEQMLNKINAADTSV